MLTFREYLSKLDEGKLTRSRRFSFGDWIAESQNVDPSTRSAVRSKMKSQSREEILEKAELIMDLVKQKLFTHFPMWRPFWSKMPPIASFGAGSVDSDGFGTMCTTGTAIFYCPFFVVEQYELGKVAFANEFPGGEIPKAIEAIRSGARHPMDYSLFVIIHEILHCSLKHHLRTPVFESEYLTPMQLHYFWNIAADYEINHTLLEDTKSSLYVMPVGGVRADSAGGQFAVDPKDLTFFTRKSAEQIFYRLVKNADEKEKKKKEEQESKKEEQEKSETPSEGEGQPGEDQNEPTIKIGDVVFDPDTGKYGIVDSIEGEDASWSEISEEEAKRLTQGQSFTTQNIQGGDWA
jgi:hypothetical protein